MRLQYLLCILLFGLLGCTTSSPSSSVQPTQNAVATTITYQASTQSDVDLQLYIDPAGLYSISYPKTWQIAPSDVAGFDVFFVQNSSDGATIQSYFAISTEQTNVELSTFGSNALKGIQDQDGLSQFELIAEQSINVNGLQGLQHVMTYSMQETPLAHRAAILHNPEHTFSISLIVFKDQLQEYKSTYDAVLRSFQLQ